jgi:hypothetical protein
MFMSGGEGFLDGTGSGQEWEDPGNGEEPKEVVIDPTIAERALREARENSLKSARDYTVAAVACAFAGILTPIMINANWVTGSPYPRESALGDRANDERVIRDFDSTITPYRLNDRRQVTELIGKNSDLNNQNFIGAAGRIIQDNPSESWGSNIARFVGSAAGLAGFFGTLGCSYMAFRHSRASGQYENS